LPVWGGLADHYGRKSMVLRSGLGIGVLFLLLAIVPSLPWFIPLVMLIGLTNGFVSSGLALTASNTPPPVLGRTLSNVMNGAHIGGTLGPALATVLVTLLAAHQDLFFISGAMAMVGGLLPLLFVQERIEPPTEPFRLHVWRDLKSCLAIPTLPTLYVLNFVFSVVFFGNTAVISIFTLELSDPAGRFGPFTTEQWVGVANLAITVASAAALPVWGRLLDRFHPGWVLAGGLLGGMFCTLPVPLVANPLQLTGARVALGLFGSGIQPAILRLIKDRIPDGMEGRALSFGTAMYMLGHGGAPLLAGWVGPAFGLRTYFGLNVVMMGAGLAVWLAAWRRAGRNAMAGGSPP
jgi:DHA1 family multidrug resistance protein-like MFS transporter